MTLILSLSQHDHALWAAGPEGLFQVDGAGGLTAVLQPQEQLYCCSLIHDRILVGGSPHVVAYNLNPNALQAGAGWQAAWTDGVETPVVCLAPAPEVEISGVLLAGTEGGGILRSVDRGQSWYASNFGLHSFVILALAWAPPAPAASWPRWEMAFACTEEGIYRSPNGGRAWKRCTGVDGVFQAIAVAPDFQTTGVVLAGSEESGLWRSSDRGITFQRVAGVPEQVNALTAAPGGGWLLSGVDQLYRSADGIHWQSIPGSQPALALIISGGVLWAAGEQGVSALAEKMV